MISFQTGNNFKLKENNENDISEIYDKFYEESLTKKDVDKIIEEIDISQIDTYHKDLLKNFAQRLGLYKVQYNSENRNFKPLNTNSKKGEIKAKLIEYLNNRK